MITTPAAAATKAGTTITIAVKPLPFIITRIKLMKHYHPFQHHTRLLATALVSLTTVILAAQLHAKESKAAAPQKLFVSPDEATKTLLAAAQAADKPAMHEIFGPEVQDLLTGDEAQDKANFEGFSRALAAACVQVPEGNDRVMLNIGTNNWPFPIPLVKKEGHWFFDTAAGREEIINRHIGRDELNAIGACRAYVVAQQAYYGKDRDGSGVLKYALKFKSSPGKADGLYWSPTNGPSPLSALVAEAHAEGYGFNQKGGPQAFHGYLFRILTSQGDAAPGGKSNYLVQGNLTAGFALVAYPEQSGKSGIMTFIVNQEGKIYQQDLGEKTTRIAARMTQYNPDNNWKLVPEPGLFEP
ncbi:MAG: hypothetical protein JWR19_163 [Pedosphaera sp.]|nr:hypothetical protein [Pedosphaera sp.]